MPTTPHCAAGTDLPDTYEAAMQELEALVSRLEGGQLPLEELLVHYERGAALLRLCRSKLEAVEQQIQVMENGEPRPWTGGLGG
ncbi:exodeoxyribonuclease VII small subunit [Tepidicella xavieri]|jgi:exodeoxyribonuclease VII small subunit|uniref:Exodeoxyribonuclease 7 small subunit n=1 Tax=Tepidicella xavieri TaxID=360241 RepID=A0A4R6ULC4_9BURK|nr:exodeoxyribonuclease VII small subunit [Tepidicella xavieri]TDQ44044.1 exodeoxyribonuclease VII small subunit [Tepidicella xavieri]